MSDTFNVNLSVKEARLILEALALLDQRYRLRASSARSTYTVRHSATFQEAADEARRLFDGISFLLYQREND